eukprot:s2933_g4.t1
MIGAPTPPAGPDACVGLAWTCVGRVYLLFVAILLFCWFHASKKQIVTAAQNISISSSWELHSAMTWVATQLLATPAVVSDR